MKSAKAIIKSVTMFASWFASIDISEDKDITFIELQQFLTRSIVGKKTRVLQLQSLPEYQKPSLIRGVTGVQECFAYSENDDLSKEEKRELKRQVRPMARGIFLRMDKNRDGTITLGRFLSMLEFKALPSLMAGCCS